jgi:GDP-L-fucose synthase
MNILITGYSGFLGKHLTKKLKKNNLFLINSKNCDLENQNQVVNYFKNLPKIDIIYHLAAKTKAGDYCLYHSGEQWISNQKINTNILSAWYNFQKNSKFITFGTSCGYDPSLKNKKEDVYFSGIPEKSLFTYAMTKRMLLTGIMALEKQYQMKWIYFIPSTLYGPGFDKNDTHFIFDLIKKIVDAKINGTIAELWGDGHQKRELIYIDDAINIIIKGSSKNNEIFNISSNNEYSIIDYSKIICSIIKYDFNKIIFNKNKYVGSFSKVLNNHKIKNNNLINNYITINNGIKKTIDYYIKNL